MILTGSLQGRRAEFVEALTSAGVAVRPIVAGNFTRNPVLAHLPHVELPNLPVADQVHENGLFVGNHHYEMNDEFTALEDAIRKMTSAVADRLGRRVPLFASTPMANAEQPLEILRTIHSFDPCLACSTHVISHDGRELSRVKVR